MRILSASLALVWAAPVLAGVSSSPQDPAAGAGGGGPVGPRPESVSPERLQATMHGICAAPRLAGSPEAQRAADYAAGVFAEAGLRVDRPLYRCFLPRQTAQSLHLRPVAGVDGAAGDASDGANPDGAEDAAWEEVDLRERALEEDAWSQQEHVPPMHGLAAPGEAEGRVFYAGYGTRAEFEELLARHGGMIADGAVALVRYGMLYRGLKVKHAEEAGFRAALLYTDRQDDGSLRGPVLPDGPWRPPFGIQRGSVYNADGDPLTPGWPALPEAERLSPGEAPGLVGIPSLPVSSAIARRMLRGSEKRLGPLPTRARVRVEQNRDLRDVENVLGWVPGSTHPDEWVIFGAHRDAWGFGAVDNGTGTTVLLETARVVGEALARGWEPERTLVFATWDAEEWGLVGSTEWVEEYRRLLRSHAVCYVNMDVVASGPNFSASCTPGMVNVLRDACADRGVVVPAGIGTPGGGSDHVPFVELAGVEVLTFGFHGGSGAYHSALDTPFLVERHLDPDYEHHASAARFATALAARLARAEVTVDGVDGWLEHVERAAGRLPQQDVQRKLWAQQIVNAALRARLAWARLDRSADVAPHRFHDAFLPTEGRSLLWRTHGYGARWFPALRDALEAGSAEAVEQEVQKLTEALAGWRGRLVGGANAEAR